MANSHKRTVDESLDDLMDNARRNLIQTLEDAADHEDGSDYGISSIKCFHICSIRFSSFLLINTYLCFVFSDAGEVETLHFECKANEINNFVCVKSD